MQETQIAVVDTAVAIQIGGVPNDLHVPFVDVLLESTQVTIVDFAVTIRVAGEGGRGADNGVYAEVIGDKGDGAVAIGSKSTNEATVGNSRLVYRMRYCGSNAYNSSREETPNLR